MDPLCDRQQWRFMQCFGDKGEKNEISDADVISAVSFDSTGDYFATGDRGGRCVLFERNEANVPHSMPFEYKFYAEFQSHELEFDYLTSVEIEEKINKIKWLKRHNAAHLILTTNDKTIKLWKVFERSVKHVLDCNTRPENLCAGAPMPGHRPFAASDLKLPTMQHRENIVAAAPRRIYPNGHRYHINSLALNSDGETFLSGDDLRINLWNLAIPDNCFNIVDIKPVNMEELTEVITSVECHPNHNYIFMYGISKGSLRLVDMRVSAICDKHTKTYSMPEPIQKTFFSEMLSSISDFKFTRDGRYVLARDYLTLKLWDLAMEREPVKEIQVHEQLQNRLCDIYESDFLFDRFECTVSGQGDRCMTGTYNNYFMIHDLQGTEPPIHIQTDRTQFKPRRTGSNRSTGISAHRRPPGEYTVQDLQRKILHSSWHPSEDTLAVATTNNLFVFTSY